QPASEKHDTAHDPTQSTTHLARLSIQLTHPQHPHLLLLVLLVRCCRLNVSSPLPLVRGPSPPHACDKLQASHTGARKGRSAIQRVRSALRIWRLSRKHE